MLSMTVDDWQQLDMHAKERVDDHSTFSSCSCSCPCLIALTTGCERRQVKFKAGRRIYIYYLYFVRRLLISSSTPRQSGSYACRCYLRWCEEEGSTSFSSMPEVISDGFAEASGMGKSTGAKQNVCDARYLPISRSASRRSHGMRLSEYCNAIYIARMSSSLLLTPAIRDIHRSCIHCVDDNSLDNNNLFAPSSILLMHALIYTIQKTPHRQTHKHTFRFPGERYRRPCAVFPEQLKPNRLVVVALLFPNAPFRHGTPGISSPTHSPLFPDTPQLRRSIN